MRFEDLRKRLNKLITCKENQDRDHKPKALDAYLRQYENRSTSDLNKNKSNDESFTIEMSQNNYKLSHRDMTHLSKGSNLLSN